MNLVYKGFLSGIKCARGIGIVGECEEVQSLFLGERTDVEEKEKEARSLRNMPRRGFIYCCNGWVM